MTDTRTTPMRDLRRFHLGDGPGTPLPKGALPALLAPFRDPRRVRHDFPLLVDRELRCRGLGEVLEELTPSEDQVLRDNLPRLEHRTATLLTDGTPPESGTLLEKAGKQMLEDLGLPPDINAAVATSLGTLVEQVPDGRLLGLTPNTPLDLLKVAARQRSAAAVSTFRARVEELATGLRQLLQVEADKDPSSRQPAALQKTLGAAAGKFLDATALAKAMGSPRGSTQTGPERRQRLQTALTALEEHLQQDKPEDTVLVQDNADPCGSAALRFDSEAERFAGVMRAVRVAELELRSAYQPERHDPLIAQLDWRDCTQEELHVLPTVVATLTAEHLVQGGLLSLSQLLLSGRPVQILVLQSPAHDPATVYRMELAYLGVAHREAFVQQSTAARPSHLLDGFVRALAGTRAGLHVVDSGLDANGKNPPLGAFLHAGAAIEGRAHPLFHYDPEAGDTWARRFDFAHNPQPDADWPVAKGTVGDKTLELPFTFADFALLEPVFADQFSLLPEDLEHEDLVPLHEHLELDPESATRRVPFLWIVDAQDNLHRAALRRRLRMACRDRLHFWHTLQELAGVRNEYVREAVQRARQEAAEQAQQALEAVKTEHSQELEAVRQEAVGHAMQNLSRMLLELDPLATTSATEPAPEPVPVPEPVEEVVEEAVEEAPVEEAEEELEEEPWIESSRCSSCNDCLNINPLVFVYNENKQARIGDPSKGTFAQLVQAAEKCPVRCIHPGKPMNPDEPHLEELVARAEPYQ